MSEVYWRIQRDTEGEYHVCCLQDFDEDHYDKDLWVYAITHPMKFTNEDLAARTASLLQNFDVRYGSVAALKVALSLFTMYDLIKEEPTNPFEGE